MKYVYIWIRSTDNCINWLLIKNYGEPWGIKEKEKKKKWLMIKKMCPVKICF